jgi:hypothetical protein
MLHQGGEIKVPGLVHGHVGIVQYGGTWLVLHAPSGLEMERFDREDKAFDLGQRLIPLGDRLKHHPSSWLPGWREWVDEIRAEAARGYGMSLPSSLWPSDDTPG